jgi:hypothetical protein
LSRSTLKFLARLCVSAALIALVLRKVDWPGLAAVLHGIDWRWAAAGTVLTGGLIAALAARWRLFLAQQKLRVSYRELLLLTWAGQFFNSVLPGSTGGDVLKIYQICRFVPHSKAAAASTVFVDRLSALVTLVALAALGLMVDPAILDLVPRGAVRLPIAVAAVAALALAGVLVLVFGIRYARRTTLYGRIVRTLSAARAHFTLDSKSAAALVLAFGVHLLNFAIVYLFARALHIPVSYGQMCVVMPFLLLIVMAPVTINGHGLREILLIGYLSYLGVTIAGQPHAHVREAAVALSLLLVSADLLWSLPGGLFYLLHFRKATPTETELNSPR